MIDWTTIKATAKTLIADLSGGTAVAWIDEPEGIVWSGDPVINLRISSLGQNGTPVEMFDDAETPRFGTMLGFPLASGMGGFGAGSSLGFPLGSMLGVNSLASLTANSTITVSAQKRFTLSLRCESFQQNLASGKHAGDILETVKTRLKRTSTIERLRGIFAVQQLLGSNWFNYKNQGRQMSCYTLDLLCATVDNDVDNTTGAGGFINEVQAAAIVQGNDSGLPATASIDVRGGP